MALSPSAQRSLVPYLLMVAALSVTGGAARYAHNQITEQDELRFRNATTRVTTEIDTRLDAYIAMEVIENFDLVIIPTSIPRSSFPSISIRES